MRGEEGDMERREVKELLRLRKDTGLCKTKEKGRGRLGSPWLNLQRRNPLVQNWWYKFMTGGKGNER